MVIGIHLKKRNALRFLKEMLKNIEMMPDNKSKGECVNVWHKKGILLFAKEYKIGNLEDC